MSGSIEQRAVDGAFWAYVQNWTARGLTLVVFFALGRLLTPADFGVFAIAAVLLMLAELLVEQGLSHAIVQRHELDDAHLSASFWVSLVVGVSFTLISIILANPLSGWFGHEEIGHIVAAMSPVFLFMSLSCVPAALLRRELRYRILAKRAALSNVLSGTVAIGLAASGAGVWTFVGQQLTFHLTGMLVLWHYEAWRPTLRLSLPHLRELGGFSAWVTTAKLTEFCETRIVDLIVGGSIGVVALGSYTLAVRTNQALTQLVAAPLWEVAIGTFSRLQHDVDACKVAYFRMVEFSSLVAIPVFLISAALAPKLIPTLFGPQWNESIPAFQILGVLAAVKSFAMLNGCLFQALGMARTLLLISVIKAVVTLLSLTFFLKAGIEGAAYALLTAQLIVLPLSYLMLRRRMQISTASIYTLMAKPMLSALLGVSCAVWIGTKLDHDLPLVLSTLLSFGGGLLSFLLLIIFFTPKTISTQLTLLPDMFAEPASRLMNRLTRAR